MGRVPNYFRDRCGPRYNSLQQSELKRKLLREGPFYLVGGGERPISVQVFLGHPRPNTFFSVSLYILFLLNTKHWISNFW